MSYSAMRRKRFTAGVLAGALALTVTPILGFTGTAGALEEPTGDGSVCEDPPEAEPFTDVSDADPSQAEIECLVNAGITTGVTETTYEPNSPVTRRQMALFLVRLADAAEAAEVGNEVTALPAGDGATTFTDIGDEAEAIQDAIDRLSDAGIAEGVTETTFVPESNVTRRQMAKFIVRLQDFLAGDQDITPNDPDDAFTDDEGDSGEEELNILAEEGIFLGDGAGNVNPGDDISRRQMANVMIRKAQYLFEQGLIQRLFTEPGAVTGTVTSTANTTVAFDTDAGVSMTADLAADTDTTDTFFIDGAAATEAAFVAATSPGDRIELSKTDGDADYDVHRLTNNPVPTSGLVGAVGTDNDTFSIITAAGTPLNNDTFGDAEDTYTVDGAAVSQAGFEAALSLGDTITIADTSTPATGEADTYALTNGSWDGTVGGLAGADPYTFTADGVGDDPDLGAQDATFSVSSAEATGGTQTYTVGGSAATFAQFVAALSNGDSVVYTRAGGVEMFALTNAAPVGVPGVADEGGIAAGGAGDGGTIDYIPDGAAGGITQAYSATATIIIDGVVASEADLETAGVYTPGDRVTYRAADAGTGTTERLELTNANVMGFINVTAVVDNGVVTDEAVEVRTQDSRFLVIETFAAGELDTTDPDRFFVNGTEVSAAVFEDYLISINTEEGTVGFTPNDTLTVVNGALAQEFRLTTNNTL